MTRSRPTAPPSASRVRASASKQSHYISDGDDDASETEAGDGDELATHVEYINLDADMPNHDLVESAKTSFDGILRVGDCVECEHNDLEAFLRIVKITQNNGEVYLHGDILQRNRDVDKRWPKAGGAALSSLLPTQKNELCAVMTVTDATNISLKRVLTNRHISK